MRLNRWKCVIVAILAFWFVAPLVHAQAPQMLVQEAQVAKYIMPWHYWVSHSQSMDPALKKTEHWEKRGAKLGVWCANAALLNMPCTREYWKRNIKPGTKFYLPLTPGALEYMVAARKEGKIVMLTPVEGKHGVYALSETETTKTGTVTGDTTQQGVGIAKLEEKAQPLFLETPAGWFASAVIVLFGILLLLFSAWRKNKKEALECDEAHHRFREVTLERMRQVSKVNYTPPPFATFVNKATSAEFPVVGVVTGGDDPDFMVKALFAPHAMRLSRLDDFLRQEWRAGRTLYGIHWKEDFSAANIRPPDEPPDRKKPEFVPPTLDWEKLKGPS